MLNKLEIEESNINISNKTITFAQSQSNKELYLLTNNANLSLENIDILEDRGWLVDTKNKTISPYLPMSVLTKSSYEHPWINPDKQLEISEIFNYKRIG